MTCNKPRGIAESERFEQPRLFGQNTQRSTDAWTDEYTPAQSTADVCCLQNKPRHPTRGASRTISTSQTTKHHGPTFATGRLNTGTIADSREPFHCRPSRRQHCKLVATSRREGRKQGAKTGDGRAGGVGISSGLEMGELTELTAGRRLP